MDRSSTRAWRRIQNKRVWCKRLRRLFKASSPIIVTDDATGKHRLAESWKELEAVKWCQVYRTTGHPCSCDLCTGERYNRVATKRNASIIIQEQLDGE